MKVRLKTCMKRQGYAMYYKPMEEFEVEVDKAGRR